MAAHRLGGVSALPGGLRHHPPGGGLSLCPAHPAAPLTRVPPARADMRGPGHVARVPPSHAVACCQSDGEAPRVTRPL